MKEFLKFYISMMIHIVCAFVFAASLLGLGIAGAVVYIPKMLNTGSGLKLLGYSILFGLPFITCHIVLLYFDKSVKRLNKELECDDKEEK